MKKMYFEKVNPSTEGCFAGRIPKGYAIPSSVAVTQGVTYWHGMALSNGDCVRITKVHGTGAFCRDFDVVDVEILNPASYA